jgi:NADH dehydrogenase [ubiquinone] 1 alpha subcomplex assembly factor 5
MKADKQAISSPAPMNVFDRNKIRQFRDRAAPTIEDHNFLFNWALDNIHDRLDIIKREFTDALFIGARQSPADLQKLCAKQNIENISVMDLSPRLLERQSYSVIHADEEIMPLSSDSLDLIISNLNMHSVNDVPGALIQINKALKPDGLFMAAMFGGDTLTELRQVLSQAEMNIRGGISPRIFPFADKQQMGNLLQRAGFALPVIDSDIVTVTYDNIFKLLSDLRGMGESNAIMARDKSPLPRAVIMETAKLYQEQFSDTDNRISATFEIIFLLGWAPHETQQKPLRPGSAKTNLADALNTEEIEAGEKPNP